MELGNMIFGHSRGTYEVPREDKWEERIEKFFNHFALDWYGHPAVGRYKPGVEINDRGGITTAKFEINPYYWGGDDEEAERPNFKYFKSGYELRWYKYPLRDSYANKDLTYDQFDEMLTDCENLE